MNTFIDPSSTISVILNNMCNISTKILLNENIDFLRKVLCFTP